MYRAGSLWRDFTWLSSGGVRNEKDGILFKVHQGKPFDIPASLPPVPDGTYAVDNRAAPPSRYEYIYAMSKRNTNQWPTSFFSSGVLRSCSFIDSGRAVNQKQNNPHDDRCEKTRCKWGEQWFLQALKDSVRGGLGGSALILLLQT